MRTIWRRLGCLISVVLACSIGNAAAEKATVAVTPFTGPQAKRAEAPCSYASR